MDHRLSLPDFHCLETHCYVYFFLVFKLLLAEDLNLIPLVLSWLEVEVAIIIFSEDSLAFYFSILNVFFFDPAIPVSLLVAGDIVVNMIMYFHIPYNRLEWQTQKQKNK